MHQTSTFAASLIRHSSSSSIQFSSRLSHFLLCILFSAGATSDWIGLDTDDDSFRSYAPCTSTHRRLQIPRDRFCRAFPSIGWLVRTVLGQRARSLIPLCSLSRIVDKIYSVVPEHGSSATILRVREPDCLRWAPWEYSRFIFTLRTAAEFNRDSANKIFNIEDQVHVSHFTNYI